MTRMLQNARFATAMDGPPSSKVQSVNMVSLQRRAQKGMNPAKHEMPRLLDTRQNVCFGRRGLREYRGSTSTTFSFDCEE